MVEAQTSKPKCSEHVVPEAPPVTQAHSSDARMLFAARTALSFLPTELHNARVQTLARTIFRSWSTVKFTIFI